MRSKVPEKIFNIPRKVVPVTLYAWLIRFLYYTGYVMGFTAFVAIFVTRFSIQALPFLFLIQAVLMIVGMVFFSFVHGRFGNKFLIGVCSLFAATFFLFATLFRGHDLIFFGLIFLSFGIFLPQLQVFVANFIEEHFSPLEGEKASPLIESAQVIGGIFAGVVMVSFGSFIATYKFFYLFILFLFLMASVLFFLEPTQLPSIALFKKMKLPFSHRIFNFRKSLQSIRKIPFLQVLCFILFFQWIIAHLLEFQYTKVVEEGIGHALNSEQHEGSLLHGLGSFHMLFHGTALVVQIVLTSRLLKMLGTAGGFLLHGIVTLLSSISWLIGFQFFTVILAKNNFEMSGIIARNAHENSYYAVELGTEKAVREFFEVLVYPLATIVGNLLLLFIQFFFFEEHFSFVVRFLFLFFSLAMVGCSFLLKRHYTSLVEDKFLSSSDQLSKCHAVELLSQKGHRGNIDFLLKMLHSRFETDRTKIKILEVLSQSGHHIVIQEIPIFLEKPRFTLGALRALTVFPKLRQYFQSHVFAAERIKTHLQRLFLHGYNRDVRSKAIEILIDLDREKTGSFLLENLEKGSVDVKVACMQGFRYIHDDGIFYFLRPYLTTRCSVLKAEVLATLWRFRHYRERLRPVLHEMLNSGDDEQLRCVLQAFDAVDGEIDQTVIIPLLSSGNALLRLLASKRLLQQHYYGAFPYFIALLLHRDKDISAKAYGFLQSFSSSLQASVLYFLKKEVSRNFAMYSYKENRHGCYRLLACLQKAYVVLESYHEADYIQHVVRPLFFQSSPMLSASS